MAEVQSKEIPMMTSTKVGVILACHNRRETTVECLRALFQQEIGRAVTLSVFLFDDGSSDGTSESVASEFPQVTIIRGDGSAFWGGGMRAAWDAARECHCDSYLWLNDDTRLDDGAIDQLFACRTQLIDQHHDPGIIVGSTRCPETGEATYGGLRRVSRWRPFSFELIQPTGKPERCDTLNGNCVLVSQEAAIRLGNIGKCFRHILGDYDYGLRAVVAGVETWTTGQFVGTCDPNPFRNSWNSKGYQPHRMRTMFSVKGLPTREWRQFTRTHGGVIWPLYYATPYAKAAVLALADRVGINS